MVATTFKRAPYHKSSRNGLGLANEFNALWGLLKFSTSNFKSKTQPHKYFSTAFSGFQEKVHSQPKTGVQAPLVLDREYLSLAFYQFQKLGEDELVHLRQRLLKDLEKFEVVGRIYLATEGINAQFSCPADRLEEVEKYFNSAEPNTSLKFPLPFAPTIEFNFSTFHKKAFKKLNVKIRKEIVSSDIPEGEYDPSNQPTYLSAEEWHSRLTELKTSGKAPLLFDVRNQYEHVIGHFEGAILPDVDTFREGMDQLIRDTKGQENKEIFMYCTGGIRCSKAGAILKSKGFADVKMLKGGITAYGNFIRSAKEASDKEDLPDKLKSFTSLFKGKNFTFDKKLGEPITDEIISHCFQCGSPTDHYTNCRNILCHVLFLQCASCAARFNRTCGSQQCLDSPVFSKQENLDRKPTFNVHATRVRPQRCKSLLEACQSD
ncbi:hypothetical protein DSO57_1010589 [Entomophthora muscae]|uniref:Uncharacterized protein n=1 Tax=Entomophthora muscae TaxID=34485 RepID=A0ACC2UG29_9FUNG|nr:hypothetical protein DSO57_1010589 [Entomophthora muscae]